jgi:aromatic-amino-acid transaminase
MSFEHLIPSRTQRPSDDPIFALNAECNARKAKGESVVNATVGALLDDDGKLSTLPSMVAALREVPPGQAAAYAPIAGAPSYHAAVIRELLGDSPLAAHAIATATPGGTGALRHAISSFIDRGQAVLTSSLYWGPYKTIADENERKVRTFSMFTRDASGAMVLDVEAFDAALAATVSEQGRALIFLNDPCQNPTGYSLRPHEWQAVAASIERAAERAPVTLLSDVAYYLYGSADPRAFLANLAPLAGKVGLAFAWSGSKSYCSYGSRIGALVYVDPETARRKRVQDALSYSCRGTWSNCNHAGMLAVTRLIEDAELRAKADGERAKLTALLDGRVRAFNAAASVKNVIRYPRYDGGFFVTVFLPPGKSAEAAAAKMRERGVFVVPQGAPENPKAETGDGLRVALCGVAERDVPRVVEALEHAVAG